MKIIKTLALVAISLLLLANGNAQSFLTNGLVAYYPFNGTGEDCVENKNIYFEHFNSGEYYGTDRFGVSSNALVVDSLHQYYGVVTHILDINTSFTISIWASGEGELIKASPQASNMGVGVGISMASNKCSITQSDYYNDNSSVISVGISPLSWHSIVIVCANNELSLIVDGRESSTSVSKNIYHLSFGFNDKEIYEGGDIVAKSGGGIGGGGKTRYTYDYWTPHRQTGSHIEGKFFNGSISDFRIYNRALSTAEVVSLYKIEYDLASRNDASRILKEQYESKVKKANEELEKATINKIAKERNFKILNYAIRAIICIGLVFLVYKKYKTKKHSA
jgi:hypothetical protein